MGDKAQAPLGCSHSRYPCQVCWPMCWKSQRRQRMGQGSGTSHIRDPSGAGPGRRKQQILVHRVLALAASESCNGGPGCCTCSGAAVTEATAGAGANGREVIEIGSVP